MGWAYGKYEGRVEHGFGWEPVEKDHSYALRVRGGG
jgi:hypothetical protein